MSKKRLIPILAILILTCLALVAFVVRPSAEDLLVSSAEMMEATLETANDIHAVIEFEADSPEFSSTGTVEIWTQKPAGDDEKAAPQFRIEVLETDHPSAQGVIAVSDGTQVWLWQPSENTVFVATYEQLMEMAKDQMAGEGDKEDWGDREDWGDKEDYDLEGEHTMPETPAEAVALLLEYVTAERAGKEEIGTNGTTHIRLIPIPEQMPDEVRAVGGLGHVWLRDSDGLPVGLAYTDSAIGEVRVFATTLELNAGIEANTFTFDIPEGAEVVNIEEFEPNIIEPSAAGDLDMLQPVTDATLDEIVEMRGALVQRYSQADGRSFTIAQGPAFAADHPDADGQAVDVRQTSGLLFTEPESGHALLTWTEGDMTFWIGGELTAEQALELANSLQ